MKMDHQNQSLTRVKKPRAEDVKTVTGQFYEI